MTEVTIGLSRTVSKTVPDFYLTQKDIQVHKKGKKPERNK